MRNVSIQERDAAIEELKFFITCKAKECMAYGWNFYLDDNAPESFKELKEPQIGYFVYPISLPQMG
mgnify:CR=1 FL=1